MDYLEKKGYKNIDLLKNGKFAIDLLLFKQEYIHTPHALRKDSIPFEFYDGAEYYDKLLFIFISISINQNEINNLSRTLTNAKFEFRLIANEGDSLYGPEVYAQFITGNYESPNVSHNGTFYPSQIINGQYVPAYYITDLIFENVTVTYDLIDWNKFYVEGFDTPYIKEHILLRNRNVYNWKFSNRVGGSTISTAISTANYVYHNLLEPTTIINTLTNDYWPSRTFSGKVAAVYIGYGPRNEFGLDGTAINYIYDHYIVVSEGPGSAPYSWVIKNRYSIPEIFEAETKDPSSPYYYDYDETDIGSTSFTEEILNLAFPPTAENVGKIARNFISTYEASGGDIGSIYDYWIIQINN